MNVCLLKPASLLRRSLLKSKKLKRQIIHKIKPTIYLLPDNNIIEDYIFICFLLGNDFVHNTPSINLRYGGLDCLLETYTMLCEKNNGSFFLVDKLSKNNINIINFKTYIYELALKTQYIINQFERSLKETAVDCTLNKIANKFNFL